ncbi:hypothetical protein BDZ94DRAFT_969039 [Collybia nuda]|uniref:Fruit-body specific protein a n=1 Tax=Collybia nuda TaxID=64659 RepID=A0A9P6CMS5_9AGAR|nr:hypothetical protein BDZ94DRAFT_969039 [Collybia nuda]
MLTCSKLLGLAVLASAAAAAPGGNESFTLVTPATPGASLQSYRTSNKLDPASSRTDSQKIISTVKLVDQKRGANDRSPPGLPAPKTFTTAVDGKLTPSNFSSNWESSSDSNSTLFKRAHSTYDQVFAGTGTGPNDRDGSIMGTAYLTYTVVSNATYNVDACLDFCDRVPGCVFANLYYEFNNELLDFVFSEKSNLKCAVYADIHTAAEKTNRGGQQSEAPPAGLTYIKHSSGYAARSLSNPPVPNGYEISFGPLDGANNAPGYMGFAFLDRYDVSACAALCNTRGVDRVGGACQFFNIWRAVVNGNPTTYTCSMYYIPAGADTAVNYGQGDLKVTYSRGYHRRDALSDGGFEGYTGCSDFCFTESYSSWIGTSPSGGFQDATIFFHSAYAHSGHSVGLLGSASAADELPGTLTPAGRINTEAGVKYTIMAFLASDFSGPGLEDESFVEVVWNGAVVKTVRAGYSPWTYYSVDVTAIGGDTVAFRGGKAPAWTFIDDIHIFRTNV